MSYPTAVRRTILAELEAVHAINGSVPDALVRDLAADIGCGVRTVWNWWKRYRETNATPDAPTADAPAVEDEGRTTGIQDVHIEVIYATKGNVSQAHRRLMENPETAAITPPLRTLAYWWSQQDAAVRAYAVEGATGLMDQQMRVRHVADERNHLWRIDHQEFPVWCLPAGRSSTPVKPWITTVMDDRTRLVLSVLVTVERPDATSVAVALADAIRIKRTSLPGVDVGGLPLALWSDNGGEFLSDQYKTMLARLGIAAKRSYPYMKHLNGKAERVQQSMQHELAQKLPGYAHGPKTLHLRDLYGLDGTLMSEQLLTEMVLQWVEHYNAERSHSALDGRTPLQEWARTTTPLRQPDMEAVRLSMMPTAKPRKVTPDGISVRGQLYTSGELAARRMVGRHVDVRYLPNDDSFVEVFDGDTWLCTAVKVTQVDAAGRELMSEVRREQYLTARAYQEAARDRREMAVATATPDNPVMLPEPLRRPGSLLGGDADLFDLLDAPAQVAHPDFDPLAIVSIGDGTPDPWEVQPAARVPSADDPDCPSSDLDEDLL